MPMTMRYTPSNTQHLQAELKNLALAEDEVTDLSSISSTSFSWLCSHTDSFYAAEVKPTEDAHGPDCFEPLSDHGGCLPRKPTRKNSSGALATILDEVETEKGLPFETCSKKVLLRESSFDDTFGHELEGSTHQPLPQMPRRMPTLEDISDDSGKRPSHFLPRMPMRMPTLQDIPLDTERGV